MFPLDVFDQGVALFGGSAPYTVLTRSDVDGPVLSYIKTWWTDEQRQSQAAVTAAECVRD